MAGLKEISMQYATLIINSKDKLEATSKVKNNIDRLTYESGNRISEDDKEKIWDAIEGIVEKVEEKYINELYEHKATSTLSVIHLVRGKKKKKK